MALLQRSGAQANAPVLAHHPLWPPAAALHGMLCCKPYSNATPGPIRAVRESLHESIRDRSVILGPQRTHATLQDDLLFFSQLELRGSCLSLGETASSPTRLAPNKISTAHQQQYEFQFLLFFLQAMCILYAWIQTNKTGTDCH